MLRCLQHATLQSWAGYISVSALKLRCSPTVSRVNVAGTRLSEKL